MATQIGEDCLPSERTKLTAYNPLGSGDVLLTAYNNNNNNNATVAVATGDEDDQSATEDSNSNSPVKPCWTLRRLALELSLYLNLIITVWKLAAYIQTMSLSVLAALLDSVLDVVSQVVLNYTEKHSSLARSSAFYPAGASRLEPIGVLTCAALMGMASFEVLKESFTTLVFQQQTDMLQDVSFKDGFFSFWSMIAIVVLKLSLLILCQKASNRRTYTISSDRSNSSSKAALQLADPTLEALAQDHLNDVLSNGIAAVALMCGLYFPSLWYLDPLGAILISLYIIWSWYHTGREQIEQLTGKIAPAEFIEELLQVAENFDEGMIVDTIRAYHFGPKFLVELEVVLPRNTFLFESHDLGMELQYEIEGREEVERCFVHIDYQVRDYDEHVVSKVPEMREQILRNRNKKQFKSHASV
jgi:cation diffusion facilitator family transporter